MKGALLIGPLNKQISFNDWLMVLITISWNISLMNLVESQVQSVIHTGRANGSSMDLEYLVMASYQ